MTSIGRTRSAVDHAVVFALVDLRRSARAAWYDPAGDPSGYRVEKITELQLPIMSGNERVRLYDAGDGRRLWSALQAR